MIVIRRKSICSDCLPVGLFLSGLALTAQGIAVALPGWVKSSNPDQNQFAGFWMHCPDGWNSCIRLWNIADGGRLTATAWAVLVTQALGFLILFLATGFGCMSLVGRHGGRTGKYGFVTCNLLAAIFIVCGVVIFGITYREPEAIGDFAKIYGEKQLNYCFNLAVFSAILTLAAALISLCHEPRDYGRWLNVKRKYHKLSEQFKEASNQTAYAYHVRISPRDVIRKSHQRAALTAPPTVRIVPTPSTAHALHHSYGVRTADTYGDLRRTRNAYDTTA